MGTSDHTMNLLLWRHADALDGHPDHERALSEKGHKQARRMAAWLNEQLPKDARILVSPALRTQQTAAALKRDFETVSALGTDTNHERLLTAAGWPGAGGTVLVVGHQPTLGEAVAAILANGGGLSVKKGAVWWLQAQGASARPHVVLKAVMSPDLL
jgi:phosphohistidine phosphatase